MISLNKPALLDFRTQYDLPLTEQDEEINVDLFACGGGASTGLEMGLGWPVHIAINHNPTAISMHEANHPSALLMESRPVDRAVWSPHRLVLRLAGLHPSQPSGRRPASQEGDPRPVVSSDQMDRYRPAADHQPGERKQIRQ